MVTGKASKVRVPKSINDLLVFPVTLPAVSTVHNGARTATHYLYMQPDAPREPTKDTPRSLFVSNVPSDASEFSIRTLFKDVSPQGLVERVDFEDDRQRQAPARILRDLGLKVGSQVQVKGTSMVSEGLQSDGGDGSDAQMTGTKRKRALAEDAELLDVAAEMCLPAVWDRQIRKSGGCALVVFVDRAAMQSAFKECRRRVSNHQEPPLWKPEAGMGRQRYRNHLSLVYPSPSLLQKSVNSFLSAFTALEQQRSRILKKQGAVPDEDGFITVSRGAGRSAPAARIEDAQAAQKKLKDRDAKRIGGDFYRFQGREKRKEQERELKDGFQRDRRVVEEMRKRRGKVRPE